ncbi:class I SAM-dependent methyltransferase [bacterium endosymbiont of Bathymodiolus sp. 5 South]|jgi:2-polyprenyl-3-methyl-5-hydroxy-6-metoxy-1,4-benzoquinol methylase|uniref:class I SAM-dependent methyltransferase n=1 Tax=bacterium endosymbiont of Bathymodiolus sp. 5 South TaxID=1181670 RepID=UPI0010B90A7A|nr:methyltransferase domain-containing protein [bacterium endosymbiont of Bathymodiolus sp. 5 South]SSC07598.1 hypothetical protein BTURTLESOX_518 [bacterium endosymbiont of Bathymodiolus sp. 5 South]VVM26540.1 hypothetical protein BSPWISOXPB_10673 [uncultured Gammaproteobacteria bacterium]
MSKATKHWDKIYQTKDHTKLSWSQTQASISLDWILNYTNKKDTIIDVGAGVSVLIDNLLDKGYKNLSLLEFSPIAIQTVKNRLKNHLGHVTFYNENILNFQSNAEFDLWHDRAVFHFLTNTKDQQTYIQKLNQQLKSGGYFLLATFAPTGPKQCSELDVVQYDSDKIIQLLGVDFKLIKTTNEAHPHPNGSTQDFSYFLFQKC